MWRTQLLDSDSGEARMGKTKVDQTSIYETEYICRLVLIILIIMLLVKCMFALLDC